MINRKVCWVFASILTLVCQMSVAAENMTVYTDMNRYFDPDGNTLFEIVYEVPYSELTFERGEKTSRAGLHIDLKIFSGETEVTQRSFSNEIHVRDFDQTVSIEHSYRDKISMTLSKPGFSVQLVFMDIIGKGAVKKVFECTLMGADDFLSDVEFSSRVVPDTTSYLENLHRGGYLYDVSPRHVFDLESTSKVFLYFQTSFMGRMPRSSIKGYYTVTRDDHEVARKSVDVVLIDGLVSQEEEIPIENLTEGFYNLKIVIEDSLGTVIDKVSDFFVIREKKVLMLRVFDNLDDEYKLLKYFESSGNVRSWDNLSDKGKNNLIQDFWARNDYLPETGQNEFHTEIVDRVKEADRRYTVFEKGWKTDRGRIYIKRGQPDEITKGTTSGSPVQDFGSTTMTTGIMGARDYEIWHYYMKGEERFYLFFDIQTSGNMKMIYATNDGNEPAYPNWKNFLGSDFDMTLLE